MIKRFNPFILTVVFLTATVGWTSAEQQEMSADNSRTAPPEDPKSSLVCIYARMEGSPRKSVGVIVEMNEKTYILTSQRNLLGADKISFTTLSGKPLAPVRIELSTQRDLARLLLKESKPGLSCASEVQMHMPVQLLMPDKNDKAEILQGSVIGVGGTKIEITTAFDNEACGAPILDSDASVIGIASYSKDPWESWTNKGTRFEDTPRYFACRIAPQGWKAVAWKTYNNTYGKTYYRNMAVYDQALSILKESGDFNAAKQEAAALANSCRDHAQKTRKLTQHKDISDFMLNEFEDQAELLEYADKWFSDYANKK